MQLPLVILGPQRRDPNLREVLDTLGVEGPLAVISAGWRHDEGELDELRDHVGPITPIPLYEWFDEVREQAPAIWDLYKERQRRIRRFKRIYRVRIQPALNTVRELMAMRDTDPELIDPQIELATQDVRDIDAQALAAVDEVRRAYGALAERFEVPWVRDRRDEAAEIIKEAGAVLVAGGHVAVLRNRMLFFGVEHALASHLRAKAPVVCWGAGGMVMTDRIVLFYDDPPDGPADPEVLDHGLGFVPNVVLFPHARERLRLGDAARVGALARRFGPCHCLGLEKGAWVAIEDGRWVSKGEPGSAFLLCGDGRVEDLEQR